MKKKISLLILVMYFMVTIFALPSKAASDKPVVIDFSYEDEFYFYYSTNNGADVDWEDGALHITSTQDLELGEKGDPYATFTTDYLFDCDEYVWMKIKLKNLSEAPFFEMHYSNTSYPSIAASSCTHFSITTQDTEYKEYIVNIPEANLASMHVNELEDDYDESTWEGEIINLRLDFMWIAEPSGQVPYGSEMYVEYVAFFTSEEDANAFDIEAERAARTPEPTKAPTPEPTPSPEKKETAKATQKTDDKVVVDKKTDNSKTGLIIAIIAVALIVIALVVALVIIKKKKK